jgi:hypothetical protein
MPIHKPDAKVYAKHAREQEKMLHRRKTLIGEMAHQSGLESVGIATLQEIFAWIRTQIPYPLLGELPCPKAPHHYIHHDALSNTIRCVKCDTVLMTVPPVA